MTPVVIMCGGLGERLHPLTLTTPKPMLPVGKHPVLETIIDGFISQGFRHFFLCVNYKKELIKEYFGDGSSKGARIKYIEEEKALGTGGALKLLPQLENPFIVTNADVLAYNLKYGQLMEHHARSNAQATMCVAYHQQQIHYGVADIEEGRLIGLAEKPVHSWAVNAGIYVLDPLALEYAPRRAKWNMTDLIEKMIPEVSVYPLQDYWLDVGRLEDLAVANARAMQ